jgi:hypothetical protein
MLEKDRKTVAESVQFQFVSNPHRNGEVCIGISGVDTPEIPDTWSEGELEALIDLLQDQLHTLVSKRNIQMLERSNLWSKSE